MRSFVAIVIAGLMLAAAPAAYAQKPIVKTETVTKTVTIEAIERSHRLITFKDAQGATWIPCRPGQASRGSTS